MKIVILDGYAANPGDLSYDIFRQFGEVVVYDRTKPEEVVSRSQGADAILTNKVMIDDAVMAQLPELKYIGVMATGTNVVDIPAAHKRGITVTNIPAYSTDSVAQMVFAHILNILNRTDVYANDIRKGAWANNPDFCFWYEQIHEISSLTIGIVGMGNIGRKVAQIALAFGMKVNVFSSKDISLLPEGVEKKSMNEILSESDIVTLHCPLTPDTKALIRKETIDMMKPTAILVNTGRGPLVDEADVAEALQTGKLGAYAADVMMQEPPRKDNPLFECKNAYLTPHHAWGSFEARQRLMAIAVENMKAYIEGHPQNTI